MNTDKNEPRDTHFAGFAQSLIDKLLAVDDGRIDVSHYNTVDDEMIEKYRAIIARRAYDLAMHVIDSLSSYDYDVEPYKAQLINRVPDMPALPEVQE